jgi:general secretion pathway protein A
MYTAYYNLNNKPFQISSDPSFIWLGEKHREALATLRYGVLDNKGFLLLTGDVGTGKTTLINTLIASLENDVIYASVPDPRLEKIDFFNYIAASFGIEGEVNTKGKFLIKFSAFLNEAYKKNKKVLLIIDESQLLTQDALEEIRLLSNIVIPDNHLLNIFFVGQNEFNEIITRPENRAVAQRITLNYYIEPLSLEETDKYIQHRLKISGSAEQLFQPAAIREIYSYSGGFPRRINIICDHCLLTGYAKEKKTIDGSIVQDCARELQIPEYKRKKAPTPRPERQQQPTPLPTAPPENFDFTSIATKSFPTFKAISALLLIGFALLIFYLVSPDLFTKTYTSTVDYFAPTQNMPGNKASTPPTNLSKTNLQAKTKSSDYQNKDISTPSPLTPKPAEVPAITQQEQESVRIPVSTGQKEESLQPPSPQPVRAKAIITQPAAPSGTKKVSPDVYPEKLPEPELPAKINTVARTEDNLPKAVPLPLPTQTIVIRFVHDSNFFNPQDISKLREFAGILSSHPEAVAKITGYTDSSGNAGYNAKLSEFRANIVKGFLLGQGVPTTQMKVKGLGILNPVASNGTEEGRQKNRRVEIKVVSK